MAGVKQGVFQNSTGTLRILEQMLDNKDRSDMVFIVNDQPYHVWSHLVAMSSKVLEAIMKEHFENCTDREIKIRDVKYKESFFLVLCSMYGIKINFTETDIAVLCEVLNLAETYQLEDLFEDLKSYITNFDTIEINSVVVLLNTAKKFNLTEMYEKLKIFTFMNAKELINNTTFLGLQWDVLVDILPSDWFYAKEIDILTNVLQWADEKSKDGCKVATKDGLGCESKDVDNENVNTDIQSVATDNDTDLAESIETLSDEDDNHDLSTSIASLDIKNNTGKSNGESLDSLVHSFRENVLKSLLPHIRVCRISALDHVKAFDTELFRKYNHVLAGYTYFSQSTEPRKEYVPDKVVISESITDTQKPNILTQDSHNKFFSQSTLFSIERPLDKVYKSKETFQIGCFKWSVGLMEYSNFNDYKVYYSLHLNCTTEREGEWECITKCRFELREKDKSIVTGANLFLPSNKTYQTFEFSPKLTSQLIGLISLDLPNYPLTYAPLCKDNLYYVHAEFVSVDCKFK